MKFIFSIAAAAFALSASPALAADRGGHGQGNGERKGSDGREQSDHGDYRSRDGNCPPGLAKKQYGCTAPGQYRRARWTRGQRLPHGYHGDTAYSQIPYAYRNQYNLNPNNRCIHQDNSVYQVDPRNEIIQQILGGLVR